MAGAPGPRKGWWIAAVLVAVAAVAAWLHFDPGQYLSLETLRRSRARLTEHYRAEPLATVAAFSALYVTIAGLSIPGTIILSLGAGAVFGLALGTVVASFASSIGATLAFLLSRFLLQDTVRRRFGHRLHTLDEGFRRDGIWYLLTLRLSHALPFVLINLLAGLTRLRTWRFYWVSQLGMLPATIVYVNAGTHLGRIEGLWDVLSPTVLGSFLLLALFPPLARWSVSALRGRRHSSPGPRHPDRDPPAGRSDQRPDFRRTGPHPRRRDRRRPCRPVAAGRRGRAGGHDIEARHPGERLARRYR